MPSIDKMFPSRYLKAGDLDGREHTVTIKVLKMENVGQSKDNKPVLYFKGADKGLVLNVTNSKRIATIAGSSDTDHWPGHKIILYPTETEFGGESVDCIRVRDPKKKKPAVEPEDAKPERKAKTAAPKPIMPEPDDDIPEPAAEEEERDVDPDDEEDEIPF